MKRFRRRRGAATLRMSRNSPAPLPKAKRSKKLGENLRDAVELLLEANRALAKEYQTGHKVIHEPLAVSLRVKRT